MTDGQADNPDSSGERVLVTGASGFIGGRIVRMLQERGNNVRAMCRPSSNRSHLPPETEWVTGDIRDEDDVRRAILGCTGVYHCAGFVGPTHYRLSDFEEINVSGTRNVMRAAAAAGVTRVVHTSSIAAIGGGDGQLVDESISGQNLMRGYALSKRESEAVALESNSRGLQVVVINPGVVYGPRDRYFGRFIEMHIKGRLKLIAFAHRSLCLAYVDDVASAHIAAMERGESGQRYLVVSTAVSLGGFLQTLSSVSGVRPPLWSVPDVVGKAAFAFAWGASPVTRFRPPLRMSDLRGPGPAYDGSKAERDLGVTYTPLREGLIRTVEWMRSR